MTAGDCCHAACLDKLNKLPADVRIDACNADVGIDANYNR